MEVRPLTPELRSADLLITFGGDGTILHLAKLAALNRMPSAGHQYGESGLYRGAGGFRAGDAAEAEGLEF
jgi:NAD kinase